MYSKDNENRQKVIYAIFLWLLMLTITLVVFLSLGGCTINHINGAETVTVETKLSVERELEIEAKGNTIDPQL